MRTPMLQVGLLVMGLTFLVPQNVFGDYCPKELLFYDGNHYVYSAIECTVNDTSCSSQDVPVVLMYASKIPDDELGCRATPVSGSCCKTSATPIGMGGGFSAPKVVVAANAIRPDRPLQQKSANVVSSHHFWLRKTIGGSPKHFYCVRVTYRWSGTKTRQKFFAYVADMAPPMNPMDPIPVESYPTSVIKAPDNAASTERYFKLLVEQPVGVREYEVIWD